MEVSDLNRDCLKEAKEWAQNPAFDEDFRKEIQSLIDHNNQSEITERFWKDLEFGTGGIRAIMGAGKNRMNRYNIRRASFALGKIVQKHHGSSVVVLYDSRHHSQEYAEEAGRVFYALGLKVYFFHRMNPVALLSFAIRQLKASAGVMVTASHNPKIYNGYKVFWNDGAQVTAPFDQEIIQAFYGIKNYQEIPYESGKLEEKRWEVLGLEIESRYRKAIQSVLFHPSLKPFKKPLKVVYSSLHGAGVYQCVEMLKEMGVELYLVDEQMKPDGDFPTVSSPNPENPEALKQAQELMLKVGADVVFATDPDCDRLGLCFRENDQVHFLSGNEMGLLFLDYLVREHKKRGTLKPTHTVIKSIVTSPLQEKICKAYGIHLVNTLTGFKWMCGKMNELEKKGNYDFLFANEESFGYLSHDFSRDKDAVSSMALWVEMMASYQEQGLTLTKALDRLYQDYGYEYDFLLSLDYEGKAGGEKIQRIMNVFRSYQCSEHPELQEVRDYLAHPGDLPASNMLHLEYKNQDKIFMRPSGTEPKIKFYFMIQGLGNDQEQAKLRGAELKAQILKVCEEA